MRFAWWVGLAAVVSACSSSSASDEYTFVQGSSPNPGAYVAKNS